jgi:hypothetical protein
MSALPGYFINLFLYFSYWHHADLPQQSLHVRYQG